MTSRYGMERASICLSSFRSFVHICEMWILVKRRTTEPESELLQGKHVKPVIPYKLIAWLSQTFSQSVSCDACNSHQ